MRFGAATLADLARIAGFQRAELATAVAIAVAASGGHSHYDQQIGFPGCGRYVGLWGIDTDRWTDWTPADLYDVNRAAAAAYQLTRRVDGFGWSPIWTAGADRPHREMAGSALATAPYRDSEYHPIVSVLRAADLADLRAGYARRIVRAQQWQPCTRS